MFLQSGASRSVSRACSPFNLATEGPEEKGVRYIRCKVALEFLIAALLFVLTLPLVLLSASLIKLTSRGPAFYTQVRLGFRKRPYTIYKLRTMIHNCEFKSGVRWAMVDDPRITQLGRFLRKSHLDELPQLWNVLKGDMSLVGPRPERPEFVPALERAFPHYCQRLLVRPGVTGLAQIQLPADTDLESVRRKLAYDLFYVRQANFWLDLRILAGTAFKMIGTPFPFLRKLFLIPSIEKIEDAYQNLPAIQASQIQSS